MQRARSSPAGGILLVTALDPRSGVWCATSPQPDVLGGRYCHNCDVAPLVAQPLDSNPVGSFALGVMPHAVDRAAADRLWRLSEQLLGPPAAS